MRDYKKHKLRFSPYLEKLYQSDKPMIIYKFGNKYKIFTDFSKKIILNENKLRTLALQEISLLTKQGFYNQIKKMFKNLKADDLELSNTKIGIRSQIFDPQSKNLVNDFVIINQKQTTHVLNAISPAWSASFAFADHLIKEANL